MEWSDLFAVGCFYRRSLASVPEVARRFRWLLYGAADAVFAETGVWHPSTGADDNAGAAGIPAARDEIPGRVSDHQGNNSTGGNLSLVTIVQGASQNLTTNQLP